MVNAVAFEPLQSWYPDKSNSSATSALTVFCDFDGPIVDVSDRYYNTYQLALAEVQVFYQAQGIQLPTCSLSKDQFWQMKQNRVPDLEIALRSGLRYEQIDLFLQRVRHIVNQPTLLDQDRLQPGVMWALALLHAQGVRLVLVTLRCQTQATQILQEYGLLHLFSDIFGTQDQEAAYTNSVDRKTQLLGEAIARYAEPNPDSVWMIGDTEADVLAGQALGISTIALTCGIRSQSYLEKLDPTYIYSDLFTAVRKLLCSATTL